MKAIVFLEYCQSLSIQWIFKLMLKGRRTTATILSFVSRQKKKLRLIQLRHFSPRKGSWMWKRCISIPSKIRNIECIGGKNPESLFFSNFLWASTTWFYSQPAGFCVSDVTSPNCSPGSGRCVRPGVTNSPWQSEAKILNISVFNSAVPNTPLWTLDLCSYHTKPKGVVTISCMIK